jgi:hypothetical protein
LTIFPGGGPSSPSAAEVPDLVALPPPIPSDNWHHCNLGLPGKKYFLVPAVYLSNWNVELVQLQPWPSWELSLSMLTWLECFCDTHVCSSWTYRMVLKHDGYWWLILWRTTEDSIILLQLHDALHTLILLIQSKFELQTGATHTCHVCCDAVQN